MAHGIASGKGPHQNEKGGCLSSEHHQSLFICKHCGVAIPTSEFYPSYLKKNVGICKRHARELRRSKDKQKDKPLGDASATQGRMPVFSGKERKYIIRKMMKYIRAREKCEGNRLRSSDIEEMIYRSAPISSIIHMGNRDHYHHYGDDGSSYLSSVLTSDGELVSIDQVRVEAEDETIPISVTNHLFVKKYRKR